MKMLIEIPERYYDRMIAGCDQKSPEYVLLKNGCIALTRKSGSLGRKIQILCGKEDRFILHEAAIKFCPEAARLFAK